MTGTDSVFRVYGLTQSYFTRKLTAYLDHKRIPYLLRRSGGAIAAARAAGWSGGIPVVQTPEGEWMWDTTDMIHYLEQRFPEPAVIPADPTLRFLCYAIEDVIDEWLYRPAVGSRWFFDENTRLGGFELSREVAFETPLPADSAFAAVQAHVTATCEPFGVTAENIDAWITEVLKPWLRVVAAHLESSPYILGQRPSLADFALFGGNAAHFTNDPLCRRWVDETGRAIVEHTRRLLEPEHEPAGAWQRDEQASETLVALLADLGRLYLPWVSRAVRDGSAELVFANGQRKEIQATPFLREAWHVLLARYVEFRSDALDGILECAGILPYYADFVGDAGTLPAYARPPRPRLNRPFAPPWEQETP
jgi:glutathione S-transferase